MSFTEPNIALPALADDLPARLAQVLAKGYRGISAQHRMSPEMSYGRHAGPAPATARLAAVLLLLYRREGHWYLPLTERPTTLSRHAGQISLPGGAVDEGESSSAAALRELSEELGVNDGVELLGRLADCYVFASNYVVTPWVAATSNEPRWRPDDREVQGVIELPLNTLLDGQMVSEMTIERGPLAFRALYLRVGPACVWGATSVILSELAKVLREVVGCSK